MHLNENLSWNEHVDNIARRISSAVGGLKEVHPVVTLALLLAHSATMMYKILNDQAHEYLQENVLRLQQN